MTQRCTTNDNETEKSPEDDTTQNVSYQNRVGTRSVQKNRRPNFDLEDAQRQLNTSFQTLNQILSRNRSEEDECDMYGKLLVSKLRKYPESMRQKLMYKIDGFLLQNPPPSVDCRRHSWTPSPAHTMSSSSSNIIPQLPDYAFRPSPSYIIPQSPGPRSPVTISIPEDYNYLEDQLCFTESRPTKQIKILSQDILKPPSTKNNLVKTAFLKAQNNNETQ